MARNVVIIGGGSAGLLTAVHILRAGGPSPVIVEPGELGAGIAYSTKDPDHRLNVPAAGMSALADDPGNFVDWLHANRDRGFPPGGFARRQDFFTYLNETLDSSGFDPSTGSGRRTLNHRRVRARSLAEDLSVTLDDGGTIHADAVVLALGNGVPSTLWAPDELKQDKRFIADPWAQPVRPDDVPGEDGTVLLVGAGLTMADMAITWGRNGATIHVASRHGLLPLAHARQPNPRPAPPELPPGDELSLAEVTEFVKQTVAAHQDWRDGIDSLRPVTDELWSRIPLDQRRLWLKGDVRHWARARHRVAPEVGDVLDTLQTEGRLVNHTGSYQDVADGLNPDVIVNCTGPANAHADNPFVQRLFADGIAAQHPVGIGLDIEADGRLKGHDNIWTIGTLRQGRLWETTAIPEIRAQAKQIADQLLG